MSNFSTIMNLTTPVVPAKLVNGADTAWIMISTVLVFIMIPGIGLLYGGSVSHSRNKLSLFFSSFIAMGIVSIQWFICGYSLVFSQTGSNFIGNFDHAFLINVGEKPHDLAPTIPQNLFMIYQLMFAATTAALAFGSAVERSTLRVYIIFVLFWSFLVYDFVAYWIWGPKGWLKDLGVLDFAGGTPVHIVSGFSALAYAIVAGKRNGFPLKKFRPSNLSEVVIGTSLIWFGWFGFNGGSELAVNSRAVNALIVTNLAACSGGIVWMVMEMILNRTYKMSLLGFCSGCIAGMVAITPAAGFVPPASSLIFGLVAGILCSLSCKIKMVRFFQFDDACDVFAIHGIGGIIGSILTGIFADNSIVIMSGDSPIAGGWMNKHFSQVGYQLAGSVSGACWAFVMSFIILKAINFIPFFKVKANEKSESVGMDWSDLGENAYGHDLQEIEIEKI